MDLLEALRGVYQNGAPVRKGLFDLLRGDTAPIGGLLGGIKQLNDPAYLASLPKKQFNPNNDISQMAMGLNPLMAGIVSPSIAKRIDIPINLPKTEDFTSAVSGTKGAEITPDGLKMNLVRYQKPEQELEQSVRNGVFYLPEGNPNLKHYKNKGTLSTGNPYGGNQQIAGETLYKNPLFVKGATGGKAPEEAYKQLYGKDVFDKMTNDARNAASAPRHMKEEVAYQFLNDYAPELADNAWHIVQNSNQGNQLRYALQEAVIGNAARQKGHDAILGFSKGRGDKGNFLSEAFDLRESHYPSPDGTSYLNDYFENLLK